MNSIIIVERLLISFEWSEWMYKAASAILTKVHAFNWAIDRENLKRLL